MHERRAREEGTILYFTSLSFSLFLHVPLSKEEEKREMRDKNNILSFFSFAQWGLIGAI